jgi:hypothetical protein
MVDTGAQCLSCMFRYPNDADKLLLAKQTCLTRSQVFILPISGDLKITEKLHQYIP